MKNKGLKIFTAVIIILIIGIASCILISMSKEKLNTDIININISSDLELTDELLEEINALNQAVDEYYLIKWEEEKFVSITSYFAKQDDTLVTIEDIQETIGIEISDDLKDTSFHYIRPIDALEFLPDGILEKDTDVITVFTAVPLKDGVYFSSRFDEGGVLTLEDYRALVLKHYFEHGNIVNPDKNDEVYQELIDLVTVEDSSLVDGNVKHIAYDDKYAALVISTNTNPSYSKEFIFQNVDSKWQIIKSNLENSTDSKLVVNYNFTDFNLALLPIYDLASYKYASNLTDILDLVIANGLLVDEEIIYYSGVDNFSYFESEEGTKIICHFADEDDLNIYEIGGYKEGISKMTKLEENPPVFILKFEN